ncbi:thymidylate synthase [Myxococcus vastator]|uniref:thymidylate synthase n=1 Tax=Myxococcus vastator TaxID=2709664 RepID=UPI001967C867|nr:thymidylate synthase [Myxococcus vastator]
MQTVIKLLLQSEDKFDASKGGGSELLGVNFRLTQPRARLSRSEMRGKVFSALGELFWCLAGSNRLDFISHYIPKYSEYSNDGRTIHGAYGPRIFGKEDSDQFKNVANLLKVNPDSRRATIQVFSASDLRYAGDPQRRYKDVPCTCTLQAILRRGQLNLIVHMRSNDAYLGLPHDIFVFTMLQEMLARTLGVEIGFYQHIVNHLHLYDDHRDQAKDYLNEDVQSILPMPWMPKEDPLSLIPALIAAEAAIRADPRCVLQSEFAPYWSDIICLLRVHSENHYKHDGYKTRIAQIKTQIHGSTYKPYVS